jgi:hypothetical protein
MRAKKLRRVNGSLLGLPAAGDTPARKAIVPVAETRPEKPLLTCLLLYEFKLGSLHPIMA